MDSKGRTKYDLQWRDLKNQDTIDEFEDIPAFLREQLIYEKIKNKEIRITGIPCKYLTEELCLSLLRLSLKEYAYIFQYIPFHLKTELVCLEMLKHECDIDCETGRCVLPDYIRDIPHRIITEKVLTTIVEKGYINIIPKKLITKELCILSVNKLPNTIINKIPNEFITEELYLMAIEKNKWIIRSVPLSLLTEDFLLKVSKISKEHYKFIGLSKMKPTIHL
jgi:hypothetical protein